MKSIKNISWNVTEPEYRQDSALSYSTLSKFNNVGFQGIKSLYEPISTPRLTFGSAVDALLTGDKNEFSTRFSVGDMPNVPKTLIPIIRTIYLKTKNEYDSLESIPKEDIDTILDDLNYCMSTKTARLSKVLACKELYDFYKKSEGKELLTNDIYLNVINSVKAVLNKPATSKFFNKKEEEGIEKVFQLKFKQEFNGVPYRCMSDALYVNHNEKYIIPIDLKTSGKPEYLFFKSFIDFNYQIQARLYWRIIRKTMDLDPYFSDFKLMDYIFVVVNEETLNPLLWEFKDTTKYGTLTYKDYILKDPFELGEELYYYLISNSKVPKGINPEGINCLIEFLNS